MGNEESTPVNSTSASYDSDCEKVSATVAYNRSCVSFIRNFSNSNLLPRMQQKRTWRIFVHNKMRIIFKVQVHNKSPFVLSIKLFPRNMKICTIDEKKDRTKYDWDYAGECDCTLNELARIIDLNVRSYDKRVEIVDGIISDFGCTVREWNDNSKTIKYQSTKSESSTFEKIMTGVAVVGAVAAAAAVVGAAVNSNDRSSGSSYHSYNGHRRNPYDSDSD